MTGTSKPPVGLSAQQIEQVRFIGERTFAQALSASITRTSYRQHTDGQRIRRQLMAQSLLLSEGMAPAPYAAAKACALTLGVTQPIEIYQAAGAENAAIHFCSTPVLLEIQGHLLSRLDAKSLEAVMGHELGHYLVHGENHPYAEAAYAARRLLSVEAASDELLSLARKLSMSMELTADRFGLLACRDLDAALRLEMVVVTGLSAAELTWDTKTYLEQSRNLVESLLAAGETAQGHTHPEHSLRAYALWLFSESDVFQQLTGIGAGTRKIADVDKLLMDVLGKEGITLGNATSFEEPQVEVQECALAACVLVASSDGEVHESEIHAIERAFAHLLPHWRELLDPAEALAQFQELAPVLYATGPRAQRTLFSLLAHVVASDGDCKSQEIEQIQAIGAALGCPELFRSLLPSLIASSAIDIDIVEKEVSSIPMPAEAKQAKAALKVFFDRVVRRRGDVVSSRRLLRLSGASKNSPLVREDLTAAALKAGLIIDPPLTEELDALHRLELVASSVDASSGHQLPAIEPDAQSLRMRRAIGKLRDKLVSGDGRSPSIRLRTIRQGRAFDLYQLEEVSTGLAERALELVMAESEAVLLQGADVDAHEGSRRTLSSLIALDRERQSRTEETGADELYVGYPFLTGIAAGYMFRGPLLLYPVAIERNRSRVTLKSIKDESAIANQALFRLLLRLKKISFPESLSEELDEAASAGSAEVLKILDGLGIKLVETRGQLVPFRDRNEELDSWRDDRLEVEDCAVLGLFPQSSSDLLQDYDDLLTQLDSGQSPEALFACAAEVLPSDLKAIVQASPRSTSAAQLDDLLPAVFADPVQREVLTKARTTPALVVDGPPGTGKSQVIVNLIADALLRGEKLAIVCEKRAALDVVVNRLEALGFRHLLALVHDVHEDRRALYQQLAARVESEPLSGKKLPTVKAMGDEIRGLEAALSVHSERLMLSKSGITLGQAHTFAAGIDVAQLANSELLAQLNLDSLSDFANAVQLLAPFAELWKPGSLWLSPNAEKSRRNLSDLTTEEAKSILQLLQSAARKRAVFEKAAAAANLPIHRDSIAMVVAAKEGLESVRTGRSLRTDAKDRVRFTDLLTALTASPENANAIAATLRSAQELERICVSAGLSPEKATYDHIARSGIKIQGIRDAMGGLLGKGSRATLSAWFKSPADSSAISRTLDQNHAIWRKHRNDVLSMQRRVDWIETSEIVDSCALIRRSDGKLVRFISPSWWSARRKLRAHLATHWPEQATAELGAKLIDLLQTRRCASAAWKAWDECRIAMTFDEDAESAAEADTLFKEFSTARDIAELIAQSEVELAGIGAWPPPSVSIAWPSWAQRIEACVCVMPKLVAATQRLEGTRHLLPNSEVELSVNSIERLAEIGRAAAAMMENRTALERTNAWLTSPFDSTSLVAVDARVDSLLLILNTLSALRQTIGAVTPHFPWISTGTQSMRLVAMAEQWPTVAKRLAESDRLLATASAKNGSARSLLMELSASQSHAAGQWSEAIQKTWACCIVKMLGDDVRTSLSEALTQDTEEEIAIRYRERSQHCIGEVSRIALAAQDGNAWLREPPALKGARRNAVQATKEGMLKEAQKQRKVLPLRTFVRRYVDDGLLEALPIWLLSPETMTQIFPRRSIFDLVIFDEASQCTVESGLPVLMRAKRAVIAGDERQMPPTSFFKASNDDVAAEDAGVPLDVLDGESLLVLARSRAAHAGLSWHYRCQQEELIAFSNHAIYAGNLMTIPSTASRTAPPAIHWHGIENAVYEDGINQIEADAVVSLIGTLIDRATPPTVGVVTFNLSQRRAILDAIDKRRAESSRFSQLYDRECARDRVDERPFVKNIENVQGDERDVIIFSLGHAPRERTRKDGRKEMYVPARFGPVGLKGGERRLNVAVSRAKQEIHIVSSFEPALLSVANSKNEGPRLFKGFLEFTRAMAGGRRNEAERVLDLMRGRPLQSKRVRQVRLPESFVPLKTQVFLALEKEGVKCELDVGTSDFRVPVAIVRRSDPSRYQLGLLFVDGEKREEPLEMHLHVPGVLKQRGWNLMRVYSSDWNRQPRVVLKRILAAL